MKITDPEEAREYFEKCVKDTMTHGKTREEAERIERSNLGYYAGYWSEETRRRVEKLFCCEHPVFGKAEDGVPTAGEAIQMGTRMAEGKDTD